MTETRHCQNCKSSFVIEPEDFAFYERLKVPAPTWCPECRMRRRLAFRSERALYKRECGLCHAPIITGYPPEAPFPVYCEKCWWSDKWGGEEYAQDYDPGVSFWGQLKQLKRRVPRLALNASQNENCPYSNYTWACKNCYLSTSTLHSENIFYSAAVDRSSFCVDCLAAGDSQFCYENIESEKNYQSTFLFRAQNCIDSHFLFDCRNCRNCFMSANLRNKEFVFENQQLTEEEYKKKFGELSLYDFHTQEKLKLQFAQLKERALHKYANILKSVNAVGENIIASKNIKKCFDIRDSENVSYSGRVLGTKDAMDTNNAGPGCELFYEGINIGFDDGRYKFSVDSWTGCSELEYADLCMSSQNVFGCVGLRNKRYHILNKPYEKAEYEALVPKIREHMARIPYTDAAGRRYVYGDFFPVEFSPFPHNTSLSQEYFPISKEETVAQGYFWKDQDERDYRITKEPGDLPSNIREVSESIVDEVIRCAHKGECNDQCTGAFKIVKDELAFYKRMNLPLPRLCPNCRHYERLAQRNPLKLWHRQCMCDKPNHAHQGKCSNEFETSYAPDRKEVVYCEVCYNVEVA
jgi:hypothetical protein